MAFDWSQTTNIKLRDLCQTSISKMGVLLEENDGLETLAAHLGISPDEMAKIKTKPNRGEELLNAWKRKSDTTVYFLYEKLRKKMDRDDVIDKLKEGVQSLNSFEMLITVTTTDGSNTQKNYRPIVDCHDTMREVIDRHTDLKVENLTIDMETVQDEFWDSPTYLFKGKHVKLVAQEPHSTQIAVYQNERDSGRDSSTSVNSLVSSPTRDSDRDINWSDPTNHLDRISVESPTSPSCSTFSELSLHSDGPSSGSTGSTSIPLDLQSGNANYMRMEDRLDELDTMPGYHVDISTTNGIARVFRKHLQRDGVYIIRTSRHSQDRLCISITYNREVINYRIHQYTVCIDNRETWRYYLFEDSPVFCSIAELVQHYTINPMVQPQDEDGPRLMHPI